MKKLRSQKAETLVETLMAIVVVVLVMLSLHRSFHGLQGKCQGAQNRCGFNV